MSTLTSSPTLLTAEEAQRKIEFIQAELLRVQRACEYRDEHPYDPAASVATAATPAVTRRAASAGDVAANSRTPKHHSSNGGSAPSRGSGNGGPTRSHLSFSEFERRRIAQLLGRVGVEIAAVWAHVHQWSAVAETGAASLSATPTLTTPSSTPVHTARGPARQSSERSVATAAPPSDHGHARQSPSLSNGLKGRGSVGIATGDGDALGEVNSVSTAARTAAAEERWEAESTVSPAAQVAALNTLIRTALAIQQMLGGGGGGDAGNLPPQGALTGDSRFDGAEAAANLADVSASATLQEESEATVPPPPSTTELNRTLPASTSVPHVPMAHDSPLQDDMCPPSGTPSPAGGQRVAIPAYLKAYVLEASDKASPQSSEAEQGTADDDDDDATVVVVNLDRGDSRSVSAGSVTGTNPRSFSRVSDAAAPSHTEGSSLHHGSEQTSSSPARSGPSATAAVPGTVTHHRFDSEVGFTTPSSPFKRVVSGSSLRSSSLIGSPVQALQQSHTRSQGYSTGSLQSQPLHVGGTSHHNGSSSAGRSPDSAEMSPAAAAAYSRSTSLLRRPHRLEVPISRTQSLRRVPSYTSPTSVASSSPPSGAAAAVGGGAESSAFYSHAHAPSQQAGRGGGSVGGSYLSAHSAPLGVSTSVAIDSPHSSMTGLHFQRVISVDSENGGWPPGSLADSLEMSQPRAVNHGSRPVPHAYSVNVASSPAPQEMAVWELPRNFKAVGGGKEQPQLEGAQMQSSSGGTPSGAVSSPDNVGAASTISSALLGSYLAPGRGGDSLRSVSVHSRNLTPHYASVSSVSAYGRTPAPPPPPARSSMQQSNPTRTTRSGAAVANPTSRLGTPATTTTTSSVGFAKTAETLTLPPRSYHIDANKLSDFLQCVHGLVQMEFSEEEFDSVHLFYFLPGVSLARDTHASHAGAPTEEGGGGSANLSTSSLPRSAHDDVPLPLFHGGDRIPVQLTKLDVFYSLVRRKVQEVCDNVGIPSESFLSLM